MAVYRAMEAIWDHIQGHGGHLGPYTGSWRSIYGHIEGPGGPYGHVESPPGLLVGRAGYLSCTSLPVHGRTACRTSLSTGKRCVKQTGYLNLGYFWYNKQGGTRVLGS